MNEFKKETHYEPKMEGLQISGAWVQKDGTKLRAFYVMEVG